MKGMLSSGNLSGVVLADMQDSLRVGQTCTTCYWVVAECQYHNTLFSNTKRMLVQYNCLVCPHTLHPDQLKAECIQYLQPLFHPQSEGAQICLVGHQQTTLRATLQTVLQGPPFSLTPITPAPPSTSSEPITEFTSNPETALLHTALSQIQLQTPPSSKHPVQLLHLSSLRQFFMTYRQEEELRAFLKEVLVEEVSVEERKIRYRSLEEVKAVLQAIRKQLRGQVVVKTASLKEVAVLKQKEDKSSRPVVWLWVLAQEHIHKNPFRLLIQARRLFPLDSTRNQSTTLQHLASSSKSAISALAHSLYQICLPGVISEAASVLSVSMTSASILRHILAYGLKLGQQERELEQAFLEYVAQMTQKNRNTLQQYLLGLINAAAYQKQFSLYSLKQKSGKTIKNYFNGVLQQFRYGRKEERHRTEQCCRLQKNIRSFLVHKRAQHLLVSGYIDSQSVLFEAHSRQYSELAKTYNRSQMILLKRHNPHKHGFSCCTHIIQISSISNCPRFRPHEVGRLLERGSKELIARIRVQGQACRIVTAGGKQYTLGNVFQCYPQKQNSRSIANICRQQQSTSPSLIHPACQASPISSQGSQTVTSILADTFVFTADHKLLCTRSSSSPDFMDLRLPTDFTLTFPHQYLVRTGGPNLQLVYVVGYWSSSIDSLARNRIRRFLIEEEEREGVAVKGESMLVENQEGGEENCSQFNQFMDVGRGRERHPLGQLSAIYQEPLFQN